MELGANLLRIEERKQIIAPSSGKDALLKRLAVLKREKEDATSLSGYSSSEDGKANTAHATAQNVQAIQKAGSPRSIAEEGLRGRIKNLLISGLKNVEVSKAVGVTESYISILMSEVDFANEVQAGRAKSLGERVSLNVQYERVEGKLLTKLENKIPELYKTGDILNALRVVGARKRDPIIPDAGNDGKDQKPIVHLHLSPAIARKFILNGSKDVVGLGDEEFIPMSSLELLKEAREVGADLQKLGTINNISNTNTTTAESNLNEQSLQVNSSGRQKPENPALLGAETGTGKEQNVSSGNIKSAGTGRSRTFKDNYFESFSKEEI